LGIISLIRSDFENMSQIFADMIDERRDFQTAPPIQRIILYIDDLDRCQPERVVEILEAIHLLLFFPLFVVVVAVDPRWLRHSLSQHYPATLDAGGGPALTNGRLKLSTFSTPQDYLEKIFQIPFALRPVEKSGYQNLVTDLLKPLPPQVKRITPVPSEPHPASGEIISADGLPPAAAEPVPEPPELNQPKVDQAKQSKEKPFAPIPPRQLEFTQWEQADIQLLWPMFRTPRTVKRFVNIYRLLRAGLVSDTAVKSFEGTQEARGEYQVALLLLAAITAFPNEVSQLLYRLDAWLDVQELKSDQPTFTWGEVIALLRKEVETTGELANSTTQKENRTSQTGETQDTDSSWRFMLDCLERVTHDRIWQKPFKLTVLRTWVIRVARFSFSVQPT
jgi:hypothetical protein